jgi:hypothetical protein
MLGRVLAAEFQVVSRQGDVMGAWGSGPFENDDALDWIGELATGSGLAAVEEALDLPAASGEYPEAPECSVAIAAAETVAAMKGSPREDLPSEVTAFVKAAGEPPPSLVDAANSSVQRVLERSELRDLWEESDDYDGWRAGVADLKRRLGAG